ncbi:hypothetical protein [Fodinibius sp. Rm-B-1B1-1]|uniref:hypothetical protein n=1 Tax=Fodinibius alkaliphilus TaxID=3140241 RepID=UPI003159B0D9
MRILTYDLNKEKSNDDYDGFYEVINSYGYAKLSESSYALNTNHSPTHIYQKLEPFIDDNDYVLVLTLSSPWAGRHTNEVLDWLNERIPN